MGDHQRHHLPLPLAVQGMELQDLHHCLLLEPELELAELRFPGMDSVRLQRH